MQRDRGSESVTKRAGHRTRERNSPRLSYQRHEKIVRWILEFGNKQHTHTHTHKLFNSVDSVCSSDVTILSFPSLCWSRLSNQIEQARDCWEKKEVEVEMEEEVLMACYYHLARCCVTASGAWQQWTNERTVQWKLNVSILNSPFSLFSFLRYDTIYKSYAQHNPIQYNAQGTHAQSEGDEEQPGSICIKICMYKRVCMYACINVSMYV